MIIYNQGIVEDGNHTTQGMILIALETGGIRDFIVNTVPDGITTSEVASCCSDCSSIPEYRY